ncbi:diaminopimelate epimerase [Vicingaceae bacterium]|nr:diaminopimelate epimerase [Vicingaceae bacterium]MDB4082884.1 diaminopimelate epimerase [Vicingaceae bacterium]MDB9964113.1 diaminopimelate epimerase [Vicingaceae bacterium]
MGLKFYKYQGTGNDFIMIDGRKESVKFSTNEILSLCDRRFGIGADGLIILKEEEGVDFLMDYYNADGTQSFCGNGSRCAQAFAQKLGIIQTDSRFKAIDGIHEGKIEGSSFATKIGNVSQIEKVDSDYFIHTGSPHYIKYVKNVEQVDVANEGRAIRNSEPFVKEGTNVNFVSVGQDYLKVRTYERGVEGETLSCGTGVTAVAISFLHQMNSTQSAVNIVSKGGNLRVELTRKDTNLFEDIWLVGPAKHVFSGEI